MIYLIVATDPNGVIGKGNTIPWHCPEDLKLFKQRTMGGAVIMGNNTWKSLPKKPLPGRRNYVLTRSVEWLSIGEDEINKIAPMSHTIRCSHLKDAIKDAKRFTENIFIIGGEQIYNLALEKNVVDRIILSKFKKEYDGDRYFKIPENWVEYQKEEHDDFDVAYFIKG